MLSKLLDSVMQKSNSGWLDEAIDKAVLGEENPDKIFSSRKLKEAVIEVQDRRKTSEVPFNFFPLHKLVIVILINRFFWKSGGKYAGDVEFLWSTSGKDLRGSVQEPEHLGWRLECPSQQSKKQKIAFFSQGYLHN